MDYLENILLNPAFFPNISLDLEFKLRNRCFFQLS